MARSGSARATRVVLPSHTFRAVTSSSSGPVGSDERQTYSCGLASSTLTALLSSASDAEHAVRPDRRPAVEH